LLWKRTHDFGRREIADYPALSSYSGQNAAEYEVRRFTSLRGRIVDRLEWELLRRCMGDVRAAGCTIERVLDLPAGTGWMSRRLTAMGLKVVAVDASIDMLEVAKAKQSAADYVVARIEELPFTDDSVDCVISVRLFGHLDPQTKRCTLHELQRVARCAVVILYAGDSWWLRFRRAMQRRRGRRLGFWHPLDPTSARALARECGVRVVARRRLLGPFSETAALVLSVTHSPGQEVRE
jgi:SAM-dependent methyltransferase